MELSEAARALALKGMEARERKWYECPVCGALFETHVLKGKYAGRQRFCSEACNQRAHNATRRAKRDTASQRDDSSTITAI